MFCRSITTKANITAPYLGHKHPSLFKAPTPTLFTLPYHQAKEAAARGQGIILQAALSLWPCRSFLEMQSGSPLSFPAFCETLTVFPTSSSVALNPDAAHDTQDYQEKGVVCVLIL